MKKLVLFSALTCLSALTWAQGTVTHDQEDQRKGGHPVWVEGQSPSRAYKDQDVIDLLTADASHGPLFLTRRLHPEDKRTLMYHHKRVGEPGRGWYVNWESTLAITEHELIQIVGGEPVGCYEKSGKGWTPVEGVKDQLRVVQSKGNTSYEITRAADGAVLRYDTLKLGSLELPSLTQVCYPETPTVSIRYSSIGCIDEVTSATWKLEFVYNGHRLTNVNHNYLVGIRLTDKDATTGMNLVTEFGFRHLENGDLGGVYKSD